MRLALAREGVEVSIATLQAGDYLLSEDVCIERKTVSDFLSSMYSGRLGYQLQLLCSSFRLPFLLLEGQPYYHVRSLNLRSYYGYLARLVLNSPIGLLQTPNIKASALLISRMVDKVGSGPAVPRMRPQKAGSREEVLLRILEAFPGIGPILAERLLDEFGSIRKLVSAPEEELARVKGVGGKKAGEIAVLMDAPWPSRERSRA
jgi:ERCC4-type nuclease